MDKVADRDKAISDARWILMNKYFVLDTETTGLTDSQMCQIAILHGDGTQYKSLVKPTIPIEPGASNVHHIKDTDVENAPSANDVLRHIPIMCMFVGYNTQFDVKVLQNSLSAYGLTFNTEYYEFYDVMLLYASFKGVWDEYHGNYKWHKLGDACEQCGITVEDDGHEGFHDAMYDSIMTDKLLKYISIQKLSTEVNNV